QPVEAPAPGDGGVGVLQVEHPRARFGEGAVGGVGGHHERQSAGWGRRSLPPPSAVRHTFSTAVSSRRVAPAFGWVMRSRATATADFDDLFRSVWARAVGTARRIVGPGGDPESVAAEALTRAYDRWPSVGRHPAPDAWVLRVAINLSLD